MTDMSIKGKQLSARSTTLGKCFSPRKLPLPIDLLLPEIDRYARLLQVLSVNNDNLLEDTNCNNFRRRFLGPFSSADNRQLNQQTHMVFIDGGRYYILQSLKLQPANSKILLQDEKHNLPPRS